MTKKTKVVLTTVLGIIAFSTLCDVLTKQAKQIEFFQPVFKLNFDVFYLLTWSKEKSDLQVLIKSFTCEYNVEHVEVRMDDLLNFICDIEQLFRKASKELRTVFRLVKLLNVGKKRIFHWYGCFLVGNLKTELMDSSRKHY